ncbi:MAG TPA: glycosyltransferase family protein, partial [Nitrososphaeraceae archaeon]|nr:glycosyltransferase family protein [Nitrososphaeraceae archaeon]
MTVKKVYFTPYGVGLGHASRLITIAEKVKTNNINVKFSSFGEAVDFISRYGYQCNQVPPVEFSWNSQGSFSMKNSVSNIPSWFKNFTTQVVKEVEMMIKFSPNVVVSDSRLSSIVSARLLGIPSLVLLNQIKLLLSPKLHSFRAARFVENLNGEFIGMLWSLSNEILVPDLPPPYTISENNIWNTNSVIKKIKYIGFIAPKMNISEQRIIKVMNFLNFSKNKPIIFFHISGPSKTRLPIVRKILDAQKYFRNKIQYVVSEGKPNGNIEPYKLSDNGWYYEWCPIRDELFALSDILVLRGGHTTMSQAIQFGKPIISIPIENHAEQISNSCKIEKIGIGIMLKDHDLLSEKISDAITEILNNNKFKSRSIEIMQLCEKLNGV